MALRSERWIERSRCPDETQRRAFQRGWAVGDGLFALRPLRDEQQVKAGSSSKLLVYDNRCTQRRGIRHMAKMSREGIWFGKRVG
jgi:hypothetical protein